MEGIEMKLTHEVKSEIDAMSILTLLGRVRFDPIGSDLFQDESGDYAMKRLAELREANPEQYVQASKDLSF